MVLKTKARVWRSFITETSHFRNENRVTVSPSLNKIDLWLVDIVLTANDANVNATNKDRILGCMLTQADNQIGYIPAISKLFIQKSEGHIDMHSS